MNDAEDDDVDVYDSAIGQNDRSKRTLAYDDDESNAKMTLGSNRDVYRDQQYSRNNEQRRDLITYTFHDGRPVLAGFMLADKPVIEETW